MPATDRIPELPLCHSTDNLDAMSLGSRINREASEDRKFYCSKFPRKSQTMSRNSISFQGFSRSSCPNGCGSSILTLLLLTALVNNAFCQSTNPLVPEIDVPSSPQEEFTSVTVGCKLILLSDLPPAGQFPLSWSRNGGLPSGATTSTNTETDGIATTYYSSLTFIVTASANNNPIICNAVTPSNSGSTSFIPFVILRPSNPVIRGPTSVRAGETSTWTCTSDGASVVSPNVYWRNGQGVAILNGVTHSANIQVDNYGNRKYSMTSTLTTALPPTGAQYVLKCILIHEFQGYSYSTEEAFNIALLFPPQLTKSSGDTVFTTEMVKTTIPCVISASSPTATSVSWTKDGRPVDYSSGRYEVVSVVTPSLVITRTEMSDAGDYVCTATNAEGTTSFNTPTTLVVRYAPRISYPDGNSFQASLGAPVTLPCPVDAKPNATTIRWKRISSTNQVTYLNIQNNVRYSGSTPQATGLTINPIEADDQGNYACEADNDVGPGTGPTISLTVNSRPAISTPQTTVTAEENSATTLACEVAPLSSLTSLTWLRNGVTLDTSAPTKYTGGSRFVPSLTILRVTDSDGGSYACVAENPFGVSTSAAITLSITYAPRLTVSGLTLTASQGETIVLTCRVDANPAISSLYWTRVSSGVTIDSSANPQKYSGGSAASSNLIIFGADSSDTGQYTCVAENSVGTSASNAVTVSVTALPQVTIGPPTSITVREGTAQTTLLCTISANPPVNNVYWLLDGVLVDTAAQPGKYSGSSVSVPSLTVRNVNRGDAGQYECAGANSVGATNSQVLTLDVTYVPTLTVSSQTITRTAGATIPLTCALDSNPAATDFYWVRVNSATGASVRIRADDNPSKYFGGTLADGTLYILGADDSDSGSYRCVAVNSIGTTTSDLVTVSVTSIPQVGVSQPPSSVTEGTSQLTLTCSVTSNPSPISVSWLKGGDVLATSNRPAKYQGGTVTNPSLTILNVDRSDSGAYTCVVVNAVGTGSSGAVQVNVVYRPTLTVSDSPVTSGEGGTILLTCVVDANPDITSFYWSRVGQGRISSASNPGKYGGGTIADQSLRIVGATSADSGQYFCTASNSIGTVTSSVVSVSVTNVPTVTTGQTSLSVPEGTVQYVLTCTVSATPPPTDVFWTRGGFGRVDTENSGTTDQGLSKLSGGTVDSPSLVIRSVDRNDAGSYTCLAQNSIGTGASPTVTLTVTYRPTLTVSRTNVVIEAGSSAILSCGVSAVPTINSLYWTKDGVRLDPSQNPSKYNGGSISVPSLTLFNADVTSDPGSYTCVAANSIGTTFSDPVNLVVSSRPIITPPPASVTGREGSSVTLPCEITPLDSLQELKWQRNGLDLAVSNSARYFGGTVSNPSLTILNPTDTDSGNYRCVATNQYGTSSGGVTTLDIQYRPRLTVTDTPISTNPGPDISLTCQVEANPAPSALYWTKRGAGQIVSSGSNKYLGGTPLSPTLTITSTDLSDAGEYFCTVTNTVGTSQSSAVVLSVISIPSVNIFPPSAVVEEGNQSLVLGCSVVASPAATLISWTKDAIVLDTTSGTTTTGSGPKYSGGTTVTPSLTINDVRRTDAGIYACVATNSEGVGTSPNLRVDVTYVPTLTVPSSVVPGARGSSLTLTCGVEAFPPLTSIKWVKEGSGDVDLSQRTSSGQNKYSGGTLVTPDLTIFNLNETIDTGVYRCVAQNARGSVTSGPVEAAVTYDPVITVPPSVTAKEGDSSFTIPCNIQMYPAATTIIWYKSDVTFDPQASPSKYQGGTLAVPTLTVLNPAGGDTGTYKCRASNGQGVDITSSDILVTVTFAPTITASTALVTRNRGQSVTLGITVDAIPTASSVRWQTSDIDSGSSVRTDLTIAGRVSGGSVSNPSLTITGLQPSDAANYYITVTNDEGSTTVGPIPLRVRFQPTNLQVTATPSLLQPGDSLTLTCGAEAWPEVTRYEWRRDGAGTALLATGQVYSKAQVGTEDWANFRCSVTNDVGTQSATIRPNIQFSPVQTAPGVVVQSVAVGGTVALICDVTANPTPTYVWYNGADVIPGAVGRTYTLQVDAQTDFGEYSCSAENTIGTLNPAVEFNVQEGEPDVGASVGGDDGLSTATIILIVIIVIIFLIIVILVIVFCCMQGLCAKWCGKNKETAKVAPTTYTPPQPAPVYMNGGLVGTKPEPTTKVMLDDEPNDVDKQFRPLTPGAIISVPEKQGPRAHYLPPLTTENENVDNYYREEKRRSRRKRKHRRQRQAEDANALTADANGGSHEHQANGGESITPGRSGDLESSRSYGRASENVYEN